MQGCNWRRRWEGFCFFLFLKGVRRDEWVCACTYKSSLANGETDQEKRGKDGQVKVMKPARDDGIFAPAKGQKEHGQSTQSCRREGKWKCLDAGKWDGGRRQLWSGKRQEAFPIVKIKAVGGNENEEEMLGDLKIGNV